jgi:hypothetical protein
MLWLTRVCMYVHVYAYSMVSIDDSKDKGDKKRVIGDALSLPHEAIDPLVSLVHKAARVLAAPAGIFRCHTPF